MAALGAAHAWTKEGEDSAIDAAGRKAVLKPGEDERALRRWFYQRAGRLHGPMTIRELQASVVLGFIGQDDLVRERLLGQWTPATQVPGLQSLPGRFRGASTEHMADSPGAGVEG